MVKHGLDKLKCITEFLSVGQIPILACDCPIFAICIKFNGAYHTLLEKTNLDNFWWIAHRESSLECTWESVKWILVDVRLD